MKNIFKRSLCLLLAVIMAMGLTVVAAAEEDGAAVPPAESPVNPPLESPVEPPAKSPADSPESDAQIAIKEDELSAFVGDTVELEYLISPDTYSGSVTWTSSDETVATVKDGVVNVRAAGTTTITAALDGGSGSSDSCTITVSEDKVKSFKVSCPDYSLSSSGAMTVTGRASFTLSGTTTYASGEEKDGAAWGEIGDLFVVKRENDSGKFVTVGPGKTTIEVICPKDESKSQTITVTVKDTPLKSLTITGDGVTSSKTAKMDVGGTLKLGADKLPETTFNDEPIEWSSADDRIAWVDGDGTVTAVKKGSVKITAKCGKISSVITVTVADPSADITDDATRGKNLSFGSIYNDLRSKFRGVYGLNPSDSATVKFSSLGSSTYGTLYTKSSGSTKVAKNTGYKLSAVKSFSFTPGSAGDYEMSYTLDDGGSTISGTIIITVTGSRSRDITIRLEDDSSYTFNSTSTLDRVSGASAISSEIKDASGTSYSYIVFDTPSSSSKKIGTLYPTSAKKDDLDDYSSYCSGSGGTSRQSPVSKLHFVPKREGTYEIGYTAYDSKDNELCSGDLVIEVGATGDDATITITLDDRDDYTFSDRTKKNKASAESVIEDAIYDEAGKNYSYIQFGSVTSGSSVGTLYSNSRKTSISTSREYSRSSSASYSVGELYFVPEKAGTYVRSFTAYDSGDRELLEGTLKIVVPGGTSSSDEMDIYFNTTTGSTITLGEDVFASWFRQQKGSGYKLAYVTFDEASRDYGTFKHSSTSFTPGGSTEYYSNSYSGSTGSSARYLKNVKYTAGSSVGCISVDFTCYGGTSSSSSGTKVSGTFCIYVTKNSVKSISYDVKSASAMTLDESDFVSVYKNAMSSSSSTTKYYIELLEIPSKGTLHYNYTSSSKTGTKLTSSNFDDYKFHVNYSSSYDSVEDLTYVPANNGTGSATVRYLARDTDGEPMYVGSISFSYGKDHTATITCGADGYTFKLSDFYSSGDKDPVAYVTLRQPSTGELMLNYVNGRGVPLDPTVRLYTTKPNSGAYPVSALTYIPKAGASGDVTLEYTAVTESGSSTSGTMTVKITGKKSSSRFKDVNASGTGSWAADSIDFAYKWGLVNGTGEDTFSPDSTMSRAMLVTILYRAAGSPKVSGTCKFNDVPADAYYYDAVIWASDNGIVTGTSSTTFSPNRDVNREQVAAFLHRFAKYSGENVSASGSLSGYTDQSSVSSYAIEPITWAVQRGYITSSSATDRVLSPGGNATRAQVAVMIHRFLTY